MAVATQQRLLQEVVSRATPRCEPDVDTLGQVFTPEEVVDYMLALRKNSGSVLEPSSGDGAFLSRLESSAVGVEIDSDLVHDYRVIHTDFFNFPSARKFDSIVGNPPYVRFQDILPSTQELLDIDRFNARTNLYIFFIDKCIDHLSDGGELIFITPRDFLKATSAENLNTRLYNEGTLTHYKEMGDATVFSGFSPSCAIWRWQKGKAFASREMDCGRTFSCVNGQIYFDDIPQTCIADFFDVKVGAVSGADDIFVRSVRGDTKMVCSATRQSGETRHVIYNRYDKKLVPFKEQLLARRIKKFTEDNWWEWGRKYHDYEGERIYVNAKTRHADPFFVSETVAYDGSVLALMPKKQGLKLGKVADSLNSIDWDSLGFVCGGRLLLSQRSLSVAPFEA